MGFKGGFFLDVTLETPKTNKQTKQRLYRSTVEHKAPTTFDIVLVIVTVTTKRIRKSHLFSESRYPDGRGRVDGKRGVGAYIYDSWMRLVFRSVSPG